LICSHLVKICSHLVKICSHLVKICSYLVKICSHLVKICTHLVKICTHLVKICSNLVKTCSNLVKICSTLVKICSNLLKICSYLVKIFSYLVKICSHLWSRRLEKHLRLFAVCPGGLWRLWLDLLKDVLDDEWVDVLGDLVEQQEVSQSLKGTVVVVDETGFDVVLADLLACSSVDHIHPHLKGDDGEEPVEEPYARDGREKYKPEVEKHVDLLVDDVKRENAEGVVLRKRTRWTKLLEGALRHLWKDSVERIVSHVDWLLHLGQHIPSKFLELVSEEHVGEEDLADDVGKVEELAGKELEEVSSSLCLLLFEILCNKLDTVPPCALVHEGVKLGQTIGEKLHDASLGGLPEQAREIEHAGLKHEHEPNPLVESVISMSGLIIDIGPNPLMSIIVPSVALVSRTHRVGRVQPAVRVHDPIGYGVGHAVDGVANELPGGDKGNGSEEDDDSGSVVQPEHMVVDADRVPLVEQSGDAPEDEGKHDVKASPRAPPAATGPLE